MLEVCRDYMTLPRVYMAHVYVLGMRAGSGILPKFRAHLVVKVGVGSAQRIQPKQSQRSSFLAVRIQSDFLPHFGNLEPPGNLALVLGGSYPEAPMWFLFGYDLFFS